MVKFIKSCYSFLFSQNIRFGATFHFVTFFSSLVLLPINSIIYIFLDKNSILIFMVIQIGFVYLLSTILSFFTKVERFFHRKFSLSKEIKLSNIKILNTLMYYFLIFFISLTCLTIPLMILLMKGEW